MKSGILLPVLLLSFLSFSTFLSANNRIHTPCITPPGVENNNPDCQQEIKNFNLSEAANSIRNGYLLSRNLGVSNADFRDMCLAAQAAARNNISKQTVYLSVVRGEGDIDLQYKRIIGHAAEGCWQYESDGGNLFDVIPEAFQ